MKELNGDAQYHQGRAADLARGDGVGGDLFGESTATSGNGVVTVVDSPEHDSSGAVYVFTDRNGTWTQIAELFVPATAELGTSLALSSDASTIVLGAARLYLASNTRAFDDTVRSNTAGPHVPMARCIVARPLPHWPCHFRRPGRQRPSCHGAAQEGCDHE